jgi:peptidyl-tRNA hydrolase, PTH1 family
MWLVVGLGNPGPQYADTYHNVGFRVVEEMAARFGARVNIKCGPALISNRVLAGGQDAVLVLPQTYMNLVGSALPKLFERFETSRERVIAVYDDIALPLGKLRIRQKGSAGGHNGVKSLISSCASDEFLRVRVGILPDRPVASLHDFVLARVAKGDRDLMTRAEKAAVEAVETLLQEGPSKAMGRFNRLDLREAKEE